MMEQNQDQDDEVIAEVRRARAALFKKCGGTLESFFAKMQELEKKESRRIVSYPPRKPVLTTSDVAK